MDKTNIQPGTVFSRAWDIISQDDSIPPEEKKAILKLIQVLIEATERSSDQRVQSEDIKSITQDANRQCIVESGEY
jgi:hypothetical protein